MEIISSYGTEIRKLNKPLCATLDIYRKAVAWLIPVYDREWNVLEEQTDKNRRFNLAEHLVHETKKNHALWPFDTVFQKCRLICVVQRSVMHLEPFLPTGAEWNCGNRENCQGSRG